MKQSAGRVICSIALHTALSSWSQTFNLHREHTRDDEPIFPSAEHCELAIIPGSLPPVPYHAFFVDVGSSVTEVGFSEDLFADDLKCEKYVPVVARKGIMFDELRKC